MSAFLDLPVSVNKPSTASVLFLALAVEILWATTGNVRPDRAGRRLEVRS